MDSHEPPLLEFYKTLLQNSLTTKDDYDHHGGSIVEDCDLPLINLSLLSSDDKLERDRCKSDIGRAAREWGFFQVINHGVSQEFLKSLEIESKNLFKQPFKNKIQSDILMDLSPNSYRWGNSKATCLSQLSWSEAFHVSIANISSMKECNTLRLTMERFAKKAREIATTLTKILVQNLGSDIPTYFQENCPPSSSYVRMNRYPQCLLSCSSKLTVFGLIPHTDSDFITVVSQDLIGGLQLLKDGKWVGVKPNPQALVINIGDLFQALSNGVYKSVKHRVIASEIERFSTAYFYCPSPEATVESFTESAPIYRKFSFREFQEQNHKDVQDTGEKIGIQRFLL